MAFKRSDRQRIIDGYLAESGANMFVPGEFVDWLAERPEHEIYGMFYGSGDEHAAREHRIGQARKLASGLRIVVRHQETKNSVVSISVREYPAYVSPMAGRRGGGGYETLEPANDAQMAELRRQGASALRGWLNRYRGAFEAVGVDLEAVEAIASSEDAAVVQIA